RPPILHLRDQDCALLPSIEAGGPAADPVLARQESRVQAGTLQDRTFYYTSLAWIEGLVASRVPALAPAGQRGPGARWDQSRTLVGQRGNDAAAGQGAASSAPTWGTSVGALLAAPVFLRSFRVRSGCLPRRPFAAPSPGRAPISPHPPAHSARGGRAH